MQFFGGRGAGGDYIGGGGGGSVDIDDEKDVWSYRHNPNNERFVDEINEGVAAIQSDFPAIMDSVNYVYAAKMGAGDMGTLGYYSHVKGLSGTGSLGINRKYTDPNKMNAVYDASVKSGYHPSRGNKSGTQAVTLHEMGHALTDHAAAKMGHNNFDKAAKTIVVNAYKSTGKKGSKVTKAWAGKISGYAKESFAECVAEAVADYYCNGRKAKSQSHAIMKELRKYQ